MTNVRRILIVEDDAELRDALVEQLALHEEFEALAAENGTKGVQTAKAGQVDLVIMDVGLPDIDGREAVRMLRKGGFKAPILLLTGHDTDSDKKPVSRETLLQEVWGYNSGVTTHTLETHIYRLRQKVERDATTPTILVTETGGYKLVP